MLSLTSLQRRLLDLAFAKLGHDPEFYVDFVVFCRRWPTSFVEICPDIETRMGKLAQKYDRLRCDSLMELPFDLFRIFVDSMRDNFSLNVIYEWGRRGDGRKEAMEALYREKLKYFVNDEFFEQHFETVPGVLETIREVRDDKFKPALIAPTYGDGEKWSLAIHHLDNGVTKTVDFPNAMPYARIASKPWIVAMRGHSWIYCVREEIESWEERTMKEFGLNPDISSYLWRYTGSKGITESIDVYLPSSCSLNDPSALQFVETRGFGEAGNALHLTYRRSGFDAYPLRPLKKRVLYVFTLFQEFYVFTNEPLSINEGPFGLPVVVCPFPVGEVVRPLTGTTLTAGATDRWLLFAVTVEEPSLKETSAAPSLRVYAFRADADGVGIWLRLPTPTFPGYLSSAMFFVNGLDKPGLAVLSHFGSKKEARLLLFTGNEEELSRGFSADLDPFQIWSSLPIKPDTDDFISEVVFRDLDNVQLRSACFDVDQPWPSEIELEDMEG